MPEDLCFETGYVVVILATFEFLFSRFFVLDLIYFIVEDFVIIILRTSLTALSFSDFYRQLYKKYCCFFHVDNPIECTLTANSFVSCKKKLSDKINNSQKNCSVFSGRVVKAWYSISFSQRVTSLMNSLFPAHCVGRTTRYSFLQVEDYF